MYNQFRNIIRTNSKIFSNFSYLALLEIFIILAPLITYPYLVRVLGMDLYGWVITAQVTASYCTILIDFGFKRISARHIAKNVGNYEKISEVISAILSLRCILWLVSFVIYISVIIIVKSYRAHFLLFFYSFLTTISSVVFLDFYFQGTENMKYITIINIVVRGLFVCATFIVIRTPSDYIFVPLLWSIGYIIGGGLSMWIVYGRHKLNFRIPKITVLKMHLKEGSIIFFNDAVITVKDKLNYNIMGAILGMSDIVIYDIGSKISNLVLKPIAILTTVLFPRMSKKPSVSIAKRVLLLILSSTIILVILANVFLPYIVKFFIGKDIDLFAIRVFTLVPIILGISIFISTNVFFAFGYERFILKSTYVATIGYVALLITFYFLGFLHNVLAFVILTVSAYAMELLYRIVLTRRIFQRFNKIAL